MPRRHILSARQRSALLDLPTDETSLLQALHPGRRRSDPYRPATPLREPDRLRAATLRAAVSRPDAGTGRGDPAGGIHLPRCRAQVGLNKGEAHHALKDALRIGRKGEIRNHTTEGHHDHHRHPTHQILILIVARSHPDRRATARMGAHPAHQRIPMAKGRRRLGCHFALSRNRPLVLCVPMRHMKKFLITFVI